MYRRYSIEKSLHRHQLNVNWLSVYRQPLNYINSLHVSFISFENKTKQGLFFMRFGLSKSTTEMCFYLKSFYFLPRFWLWRIQYDFYNDLVLMSSGLSFFVFKTKQSKFRWFRNVVKMCSGDHQDSLLTRTDFEQLCANVATRIIDMEI